MRWILRSLHLLLEAIIAIVVVGGCVLRFDMHLTPPLEPGEQLVLPERVPDGDRAWRVGADRLAQNDRGVWEAYVEGPDLERGSTYGVLARDLIERQEELFVDRIRLLVPDETKLGWLRYGVAIFDRNIEDHIPMEFRREIYGESRSFSDAFDFIAPKYDRALNYHAAHDIGHALQDLAIVGCTSFAVWGDRTADGKLLVGRNFDFYMGEDFACDKVVLFMRPEQGHPFAEITWGGMMGAVSGMNLAGLTVTINAARSAIPFGARTPISLLAREILQYASTIDEAIAIAKERDVFVSEAILVSSAKDARAAVIEKAPDGMGVYDPDSGAVVCANHYQSKRFRDSAPNLENIKQSDSMGRYRRMWDLLNDHPRMGPTDAAEILRDRMGPDGRPVGLANPMAIDQMIAHHSVVFRPEDGRMWLSVGPYQLGEYLCYDLPAI
ncbi:MAG: acyl-CoA--6-aminopenicillanic acid acyl-transferase, partial [Flavobacteriales bacterium]|nr:acyl-CoA--6-aminopenicillanic acid acyl-transferase [Flavobacteriales bacterium]